MYKVEVIDLESHSFVGAFNIESGDLILKPKHSCYNCKNLYTFKSSEEIQLKDVLRCCKKENFIVTNMRNTNECEFFELYNGGELDYSI